jgi:hypothetical protein
LPPAVFRDVDDEEDEEDDDEAEAAEDGDTEAGIRCGGGGARRAMHETCDAGADWSGIERQCALAPRKPARLRARVGEMQTCKKSHITCACVQCKNEPQKVHR